MINYKVTTAVLILTILGFPAATTIAQAGLHKVVAVPEASAEQLSRQRLTAFEQAKISLADAISIAEGTMGGIVIEANFHISDGHPVYMIKAILNWDKSVGDKSVREESIDPQTGKVMSKGKPIPLGLLNQQDQLRLASLHPWNASLGEAVTTAEDYGSGKPISARFAEAKGQNVFEVMVLKNISLVMVAVDATDGHVIS